MNIALKVDMQDNVATVFSDNVNSGDDITVMDREGNKSSLRALSQIPYGHKIALESIRNGQAVIKYGQIIGKANKIIQIGEHVHVHNIESLRGRGDLRESLA